FAVPVLTSVCARLKNSGLPRIRLSTSSSLAPFSSSLTRPPCSPPPACRPRKVTYQLFTRRSRASNEPSIPHATAALKEVRPGRAGLGEVEHAERAAGDALRAAAGRQREGGDGAGGGDAADLRSAGLGEPQRPVRTDRDALRVVVAPRQQELGDGPGGGDAAD